MPLKDIEPSMEERRVRDIIKQSPVCPWCDGPKELGNVICWKCYQAAWRLAHEQS